MKIAVFVSGSGTTLQSIIDNIKNKELNIEISLVVSSNDVAYALTRAKDNNIKTHVIKSVKKEDIDIELSEQLEQYDIDLIVLAGYLKMIGEQLINRYTIINTHPSLLPKFGGKGMYGMNVHEAVIKAKEKYSGVTLHYVNANYDEGNIIEQTIVKVEGNDTAETLSKKVQEAEKKQLIKVLKNFANRQVR